jgi:hypothetical protein
MRRPRRRPLQAAPLRDDELQWLMFQSAFLGKPNDRIELLAGAAKRFTRGRGAVCLIRHGDPFSRAFCTVDRWHAVAVCLHWIKPQHRGRNRLLAHTKRSYGYGCSQERVVFGVTPHADAPRSGNKTDASSV